MGLAGWVLEETPGWGQAEIETVIATGAETRAILAAPMPIHIVYLTAFPDAAGTVTYAPDVYGRNAPLFAALLSPVPPPEGAEGAHGALAALPPDSCFGGG